MPLNNKPAYYICNGRTASEQMLRDENPNTSFPTPFTPPEGWEPVYPGEYPEFDPMTQFLMEDEPVFKDGTWRQSYVVRQHSDEVIAANRLDVDRKLNAKVKAQIAELEKGQQRALREAALGQPDRLAMIEADIQALRESLIRDKDGNVV